MGSEYGGAQINVLILTEAKQLRPNIQITIGCVVYCILFVVVAKKE